MPKRKPRRRVASIVEKVEPRILLTTNSWTNTSGGDWDTATNWSLGHVPTASEDVVISAAGSYTVSHNATSDDSVLSLTVDKPLTISAGQIEIMGGGLSLNSTLTLSAGANTAALIFDSNSQPETIGGSGTIDLAGADPGNDSLSAVNTDPTTISSGISIVGDGQIVGDLSSIAFINQGTIDANVSGQTLSLHANIENQATEEATGGGNLDVTATAYTNDSDGTISVTGGGTLTLGDSQSEVGANAGAISETNSTLNLGDTFTNTGTISRFGGTVNLTGLYNLNSGSFTLTTALGQWFMVGGGFENGTLAYTGSGVLTPTSTQGVFTGMTLASNFTIPDNSFVEISNGLTLDGVTVTFQSAGNTSEFNFNVQSGQPDTLGGSGTIDFAGTSPSHDQILVANEDTLTIAAGITIEGGGQIVADFSGDNAFINQGVINANVSGQTLTVHGNVQNMATEEATNGGNLDITETTYTNDSDGTISVTGGGTLTVGDNSEESGSNAGTISETDSTLNLGDTFTNTGTISRTGGTVNLTGIYNLNSGALTLTTALGQWFLLGGGLENGTFSSSGSGVLTPTTSPGTLSNMTLDSNLILTSGTGITVSNNLTLNAKIRLKGATTPATLTFLQESAPQSLNGSGQIIFAGTAASPDRLLSDNEGVNSPLTIGSGIILSGADGEIITNFNASGIVNNGIITANVAGGTLTVGAQGLTNNGVLEAAPGTLSINGSFADGAGTMTVGIGGTVPGVSYGQINCSATLTLGGTFNSPLLPNFTPTADQLFTPITDTGQTGSFSKTFTQVGAGDGFTLADGATSVSLTATTSNPDFADLNSSLLTVTGGSGNDVITLNQAADVIKAAMNGTTDVFFANRITGEAVSGNAGNDSIVSHISNDTLVGNAGNDTLITTSDDCTLQGAGGNDSIVGASGDSLRGGASNDSLTATGSDNTIVGGGDDDTIIGGSGNNTLAGGPGNDSVVSGSGATLLISGIGTDTLDGGNVTADTLQYSSAGDSLINVAAGDSVVLV